MTTNTFPTTTPVEIAHATLSPAERTGLVEHAVVLADVDWHLYCDLRDKPANRGLRMTYAEGVLEIMTLGLFHERISLLIDHFILEWRVARQLLAPNGFLGSFRSVWDLAL
jgi:hypothetical protein